jgi:hypothetical protein
MVMMQRNTNIYILLVRIEISASIMEISIEVYKSLKNRMTYDPAIPLLDIYLKESKYNRDAHTPTFLAVLFRIASLWNLPMCPTTDE